METRWTISAIFAKLPLYSVQDECFSLRNSGLRWDLNHSASHGNRVAQPPSAVQNPEHQDQIAKTQAGAPVPHDCLSCTLFWRRASPPSPILLCGLQSA